MKNPREPNINIKLNFEKDSNKEVYKNKTEGEEITEVNVYIIRWNLTLFLMIKNKIKIHKKTKYNLSRTTILKLKWLDYKTYGLDGNGISPIKVESVIL